MRILFICHFSFLLAACSNDVADSTANEKIETIEKELKVYRHFMDGTPASLDPARASSSYANFIVLNVFDTLFSYKYLEKPYVIKPNLAVGLPEISDDGLTYTIKLKKGVMYQTHPMFGKPATREVVAEDFVYSIKRIFDPKTLSNGQWLFANKIVGLDEWQPENSDYSSPVEGLQALDSHTLQIKLTQPYPQLIYVLAMGYSAMVPHESIDYFGDEFGSKVLGSGPFKLEKFNPPNLTLVRNENYRLEPFDVIDEGYNEELHGFTGIKKLNGQRPPFVDVIEIDFIKNDTASWLSFNKANEIQLVKAPKDKLADLIDNEGQILAQVKEQFHTTKFIENGFVYAGFNMLDPHYGSSEDFQHNERNKDLRCAIRNIYNWPQQNKAFYGNIATVFPGIIPPVVPEFDRNLDRASIYFNPERAKQLLLKSEWKQNNLPLFEYHINSSSNARLLYEFIRGMLAKIGYSSEQVKLKMYPSFGSYAEAIRQGDAPFFLLSWNLDYPDAENTLQLFYGPNASPGSNKFNYQNPEYDTLFEKAQSMQFSPERTQIYHQLNQMVIDDCVVISGLSRNRIYLWHKNVVMFPDNGMAGGFFLKYVDLE